MTDSAFTFDITQLSARDFRQLVENIERPIPGGIVESNLFRWQAAGEEIAAEKRRRGVDPQKQAEEEEEAWEA